MADITAPVTVDWDYPRGVAGVALLVDFGTQFGVPAPTLLRGSGVGPAVLTDPTAQVDARAELSVIRNLCRELGQRPGLGLEVGTRYRLAAFGVFGFACMSSPTFGEAVALGMRYLDLSFTFCIPIVTTGPDEIRMELHDERVPLDVRQFLVERDVSATFTMVADLLGAPLTPTTLQFRFPRPAYADRFTELLGAVATFDAPTHAATFSPDSLDRPLPQANRNTVALCEAQCRALVEARRARIGLAHEVRKAIMGIGGAADMDTVARDLGLSTRHLRRQLAEAGTSYRALREEVLETLALELLDLGVLSVEDVAVRLGYAEASSFIHAFKQWTGRTPHAYARRATSVSGDDRALQ